MADNAIPESLTKEFNELAQKKTDITQQIQSVEKELSHERDNVIRTKRKAVSDTFDKQLKSVDAEIKSVTDKRQKARSQGVKSRVREQTAALASENIDLEQKMSNLFRDNHVPGFCRSGLFYTLMMPRGAKEIGGALLAFLLVFAVLPFAVHALLSNPAVWHWALIYIAVIVVFGGLYLLLNNCRIRHLETIREGRTIRNQIAKNKKEIKKISRGIRRDQDDAVYDLQSFDDLLSRKTQEKEELTQKRKDALEQFDAVTKNVLSDEVTQKYQKSLSALNAQLESVNTKSKELEEKMKDNGKASDGQGNL